MPKVKATTKAKVKKKPVKAGSTDKTHGGFPTQKAIQIRSKIISKVKRKTNG